MDLKNWKAQARSHWREFQPQRFKELAAAGKLDQALAYAVEQTHREMSSLEAAGLTTSEASANVSHCMSEGWAVVMYAMASSDTASLLR